MGVDDLLARLVAFDSTSGSPSRPIADFVVRHVGDVAPGCSVTPVVSDDGRHASLFIETDAARDGAPLMLSGHLDAVPADEPEWRSDPFELSAREDRLHGRGACDMKGFVAVALDLLAWAQSEQRPLALLLTHSEELGSLGLAEFLDRWERPLPRTAIIGEPTAGKCVRLHKGHLKIAITLHGVAAHSGLPHLGENAIEGAGPVIAALRRMRHELEHERVESSTHFPRTPYETLNIGTIRGGSAINVVPDACRIEVGLRTLPGGDRRRLIERVRHASETAGLRTPPGVEIINDNPPMLTGESARIVESVCSVIGQRGTGAVSFASDGGRLSEADVECVLFGPGDMERAHKPNEYVLRSELDQALEATRAVIERECPRG